MVDSVTVFAGWLNAENISVAFLPAATWNRLAAAIAARKVRPPARLRLVIATEGDASEGSFGRVLATIPPEGVRVCRRVVLESAGGTLALDDRMLPAAAARLRVLDPRGQPLPLGLAGELVAVQTNGHWTRTGELARCLPNESIELLGSLAAQAHVRGLRLDLRRKRDGLCRLPGVRHAVMRRLRSEADAPLVGYIFPDAGNGSVPDDGAIAAAFAQTWPARLRHSAGLSGAQGDPVTDRPAGSI